MSNVEKQKLLDSYTYPPNHNYDLTTLEPKGLLSERLDIIKKVVPNFFEEGHHFLDIGCNKGFFSFYGSCNFDSVTGVDVDLKFVDLCNDIKDIYSCNFEFMQTGFRDFIPKRTYDRIMLGNVHHYVFREASGTFDWVYKLAAMSNGLVIIEGPKDMACKDMERVFSKQHDSLHMRQDFTEDKFLSAMNLFFTTKSITPSVNADRYMMVFERKDSGLNRFEALSNYRPKEILRKSTDAYWTPVVYKTEKDIICKVDTSMVSSAMQDELFGEEFAAKNRDTCGHTFSESLMWLKLAAVSPFSNGILNWLTEGNETVGWAEKDFLSDYELCRDFECEKENFIFHCKSQIFYLRQGLIDLDAAIINFAYNRKTKHRICFDKGAVYPVTILMEKHWDKQSGSYRKCLRRSYKTIPEEVLEKILESLSTKDSQKIEAAYTYAVESLTK